MKIKIIRLLALACAITLFLVSCADPASKQAGNSDIMRVYYKAEQSEGSLKQVIGYEQAVIPQTTGDRIGYLVERLFKTPQNESLKSAFPQDAMLESYELINGKLSLKISGSYKSLTDMELTIAESCTALTLCGYPGVDSVELSIIGADGDKRTSRALSDSDIVLSDISLRPVEQEITLYFADEQLRYMVPEKHKIIIRENEQMERYVAEEMLGSPRTEGLTNLIPEGTKLLSVVTEERVCYINLSNEFINNFKGNFAQERLILNIIANSITSLNGIDAVQILVDGSIKDYYKYLPIGKPLKADLDTIGPVETASDIRDVTVYYPVPNSSAVAAMPKKVVYREGVRNEQLALEQLGSGSAPFWTYNPIPSGTKILSLEFQGSTCKVVFSEKFVEANGEPVKAAINAIVSTITGFGVVSSVSIRAEDNIGRQLFEQTYSNADTMIQK